MREELQEINSKSIISVNEIRSILNDFQIGKKPLAKLLGWGETTIIRYIEGDIPTSEYSNKLRLIADEPLYYYELLMKNKDNLTNVAFRKSRKAVLDKILESKISLIAQMIMNLSETALSPTYIQYLLYYAQAFSLAFYDRELFSEDYCVNNDCMPYKKIYDKMNTFGSCFLEIPDGKLSTDETKLIKKVVDSFSWYGPKALRALNNSERMNLHISRDKESNRIIAKDTMKNYYKEILHKYDMQEIDEIHKYPDIRILEIKNA